MEGWAGIEWLVGYVGVAAFALFLLDRSHRTAFAKLEAVYDKEMEHQQILIEMLQIALEAERLRSARRAKHPDLETSE